MNYSVEHAIAYGNSFKLEGSVTRTDSGATINMAIYPRYSLDIDQIYFGMYYTTNASLAANGSTTNGTDFSMNSGWTKLFFEKSPVDIDNLNTSGEGTGYNGNNDYQYSWKKQLWTSKACTISSADKDKTIYIATCWAAPGFYSMNSGVTVYNVGDAQKVSTAIAPLYTAPSGFSVTTTASTSTTITAKASWTNGSKTSTATVTAGSSSGTISTSGGTAVLGSLTPNSKYTISGTLTDSTTTLTASTTAWTSIATPVINKIEVTTSTAVITAGANGNANPIYRYNLNNGTWSENANFTGVTPNKQHTAYVKITNPDHPDKESASTSMTFWTKAAAPKIDSIVPTSTTVTINAGPNGNDNPRYLYRINNGEWSTNNVFTNLSPNTKYTAYVKVSNTDNPNGESETTSQQFWTNPVANIPTLSLVSGNESEAINVIGTSLVESNTDQFGYSIDDQNYTWKSSNTHIFTGLTPNTTYTVYTKVKNTETGVISDAKSTTIKTWYALLTNLKLNLVDSWYWYLEVNCSYTYSGIIAKYEFAIGAEGYRSTGTTNSHRRGTSHETVVGKLSYNTEYLCQVRVTDNHDRTYTASATFKTLDERCLYVDGELREVKLIQPDGTVKRITPNLLSVIKPDGTIVNMNKIINNDNRTEH